MAADINSIHPQNDSTGGYATVNGIQMYYEVHGNNNNGIPLVLIHGGGSTIPSNWGTVLPVLSKYYKVIAMELQAHGRTGDRNTPESFQQDAADVLALLQYLHISQADIIGFSDGGCTTLEIAIHHPGIIHKMVVISSNYKRAGMVPGFFEGLEKAGFKDMPKPLVDAYLAVNPSKEGVLNMFDKDRARRLAFKDRSDADMQSIKVPVLFMAGDHDVITTEHTVAMSKLVPGAGLTILPGTHGSFIGEALTKVTGSNMPGIATSIIRDFLDK